MSSHKGEPLKITGEIPVSLNLLSVVNGISVDYLRVKGFFYFLIGLTWIFFQSPSREAGLAWIDFLTPTAVGIIWLVSGVISVITGFIESPKIRRLGFFVLIMIPGILGFYFLCSWFIYVLPLIESNGYQRGLVTTISYWAFSCSAYIMARVYSSSYGGIESTNKGARL